MEPVDNDLRIRKTRFGHVAVGPPHIAGHNFNLTTEIITKRLEMGLERLFPAIRQHIELNAPLQIGQDTDKVTLAFAVRDLIDTEFANASIAALQVDLLLGELVVEPLDGFVAEVHERCYFGERLFGAEFKDPLGLPARVALAGHNPVGGHVEVAPTARADQLWNAQVQPDFFARYGEILNLARVVLIDKGCGFLADGTRCSLG